MPMVNGCSELAGILDFLVFNHPASTVRQMSQPTDKPPDCFGNLEIVFPLGDDGLRHTPAPCFPCPFKTECLRNGLKSDAGLKVREEKLNRSYHSGMIGFMERWSQKKAIERRKKNPKTLGSKWRLYRRKSNQSD